MMMMLLTTLRMLIVGTLLLLLLLLIGLLVQVEHSKQQQQRRQQPQQQQLRLLRDHEAAIKAPNKIAINDDPSLTSTSPLELKTEIKEYIDHQEQQQQQNKSNNINNNHLNDTDKIALALYIQQRKVASNSLYHYFHKCHMPHPIEDLKILYWDHNGQLDNISIYDERGWWNGNYSCDRITNNNNRPYGTMALLMDTDIMLGKPYLDVPPPIPMLMYSIYNGLYNSSYYKVIPTPYDKYGWTIEKFQLAMKGAAKIPFHEKNHTIIWRGAKKPIRDKLLQLQVPYLDASADPDDHTPVIDMSRDYKYHIDIGGNSGTSWGGLRWKLCSEHVVFKVESFARDWWYDYLIPWQHYIPVQDDLSDLETNYLWAESHPDEAYKIAQAGAKICLETFEPNVIEQYEYNVIQSLPPVSKDLYDELQLIREGYLILSDKNHPPPS